MRAFVRVLIKPVEMLVAAVLMAMACALMLEVVLRFAFEMSLPWTSEFARYAMIWITFLGAALAVRERGHIQVTFFVNLLPGSARKYAFILIDVLLLAFIVTILRYSIEVVQTEMKMTTAALDIPFGFVVLALPVSGVLMIIYLLADIADLVRMDDVTPSEENPQW